MSMPIYASPEQFMRDRSDYARKGIGRGRSVVITTWSGGVLFVAENHSPALHKVSEIYDRIGFAAVGRYNEFENLRTAGIRLADVRGFSYDRRDVTGRWLANAYAQTLGSIFSEHQKPFEVELCVAEVAQPGESAEGTGQLYKISYDGSITDERTFIVMGGLTEPVVAALQKTYSEGWGLGEALRACTQALGASGEGAPRLLRPDQVEVAVLERNLPARTFRRIEGATLTALLGVAPAGPHAGSEPAGDSSGDEPPAERDTEPADAGRSPEGPQGASDEPDHPAVDPADQEGHKEV